MKLQLALPYIFVCLVLASCSDDNNNPIVPAEQPAHFEITTQIEYAVYRAVIEQMYVHDKRKLIVIADQTVYNPAYIIGAFDYPDILNVSPETLTSFQKQNQQPQAIDCTQLALSVPCKVSDENAISDIFTNADDHPQELWDNWDRFYEKYPGSQGLMDISRVGFNADGSKALVYVGNVAYDLVGEGFHVLLVRNGDTWVVHSKEMTWQS